MMLSEDISSMPAEPKLTCHLFAIDETPHCLWDWEISTRSLEFLENLKPDYFAYLADVYNTDLEGINPQFAAIAIRVAYSQGLETLFALLGAAIQAPWCVPGWVTLYKNQELESLIRKIHDCRPVYSILGKGNVKWEVVSQTIHSSLVLPDQEKEKQIKSNFAILWARFARDFLDEQFRKEYNSLKHGFRVKPGGFHLTIGVEDTPGIPAKPEKMCLIGKSEYGSTYLVESPFPQKKKPPHTVLKWYSHNWSPEDMLWGLYLISMSLNNIIGFLKIYQGVVPADIRFEWPSDENTFEEPWKRSRAMGINNMGGPEYIIPTEVVEKTQVTKEDVFKFYEQFKDFGEPGQ